MLRTVGSWFVHDRGIVLESRKISQKQYLLLYLWIGINRLIDNILGGGYFCG